MFYVYLLRSISFPDQSILVSQDLKARLRAHNAGESKHTAKYAPWELVCYFAFKDKRKAQEFEHYLKTGSGQAFAKKRFWRSLCPLKKRFHAALLMAWAEHRESNPLDYRRFNRHFPLKIDHLGFGNGREAS